MKRWKLMHAGPHQNDKWKVIFMRVGGSVAYHQGFLTETEALAWSDEDCDRVTHPDYIGRTV